MTEALYGSPLQRVGSSPVYPEKIPGREICLDERRIIVRPNRISSDAWDRFAIRCDASFFCSRSYLSALGLLRRVIPYEFFDGEQKVGQCALARGSRRTADWLFLDTLMLLPEAAHRWPEAMSALLRHVGPGDYRYGSVWTTEPSREEALRALPNVSTLSCWRIDVQAVDFRVYASWDVYEAALSTNVKRNIAKARRHDPDMRLEHCSGWRALLCYPAMLTISRAMYRRKNWPFGFHDLLHLLHRLIIFRREATVTWVIFEGRRTAFTFTVWTGKQVYYLHGASLASNGGSAWYLLLDNLRQAYRRNPSGRFVMGCEQADHPSAADEVVVTSPGVMRQRLQCRASRFPTSRILFRFGPTPRDTGANRSDATDRHPSSGNVVR